VAKDVLVNLLLWCTQERESLKQQLEALKAGRVRIFEADGTSHRDVSGRSIARITASIASLDKIVAELDRSNLID
jgi:hypothetical protein